MDVKEMHLSISVLFWYSDGNHTIFAGMDVQLPFFLSNSSSHFKSFLLVQGLLSHHFWTFLSKTKTCNQSTSHQNMAGETPKSIYDFSVKDIQGNDVSLNDYTGKVLLIVNVASKCGLTHSNYKELNVLYEKYKNQGFEILAFPCNQFAGQEPGSNEEIKDVVCTMFKAEFPVFDKVEVNGKNAAPLYKYLKSQKGGLFGDGIKWNFTKFLVDKNGKVVQRYAPTTSPMKIEKDIQNLLSAS